MYLTTSVLSDVRTCIDVYIHSVEIMLQFLMYPVLS